MTGVLLVFDSVLLQSFVPSTVSFTLDDHDILIFSALSFFLCTVVFLTKLHFSGGVRIDKPKAKKLIKLNLYTALAFFTFHTSPFFICPLLKLLL